MQKKRISIPTKAIGLLPIALILLLWQMACSFALVPAFMLPSPLKVLRALWSDAPLLLKHMLVSLEEAALGLLFAVVFAFLLAVAMDRAAWLRRALSPLISLSQTIPVIAVAPLLVLWLGYGVLPKIALVFITCFFPLTISLLGGLQSVDEDFLRLYRSMGATRIQILRLVKLPASIGPFFSGLRVSAAYAIVGAVIAEWLGGNQGLGVYMTRVRKGYAFDKLFAAVFVICALSLLVIKAIEILHKKLTPWEKYEKKD